MATQTMRAIQVHSYGGPELLAWFARGRLLWHALQVSKQIKIWLHEQNQIVRNEGSFFFL